MTDHVPPGEAEPDDMESLKRAIVPLPKTIRDLMEREGVLGAYKGRPPYQRNDYLAWISDAAKEETRAKRLAQMIDELKAGDVYMGMEWRRGRDDDKPGRE